MNLVERVNSELEYVKRTSQEGDSVDCYARTVEYIIPIFAEFIEGIENPFPCDIDWIISRSAVEEFRSTILSELEKMK